MIKAYQQSIETMNMLRSLSSSYKFSNINVNEWNTDFKNDIYKISSLKKLLNNIENNLNLLKGSGIENNANLNQAILYTGHEGLLLPYEESFTRKDRFTNKYYDCSAHFLWIGERTRNLDEAHVEFFKGIENPIGIKISDKIDGKELIKLIEILNPNNEKGKICLITRMGNKLKYKLPMLIDEVTKNNKNVIWICDPMHGNTKSVFNTKTRYVSDIYEEICNFFKIHNEKGTIPGGIHLEMTGNNVTECLGGSYIEMSDYENFLDKNYLSACDPRLNLFQTIEIIEKISKLI
jgi:3-deoxy-7-phosphoheptulonate synthase